VICIDGIPTEKSLYPFPHSPCYTLPEPGPLWQESDFNFFFCFFWPFHKWVPFRITHSAAMPGLCSQVPSRDLEVSSTSCKFPPLLAFPWHPHRNNGKIRPLLAYLKPHVKAWSPPLLPAFPHLLYPRNVKEAENFILMSESIPKQTPPRLVQNVIPPLSLKVAGLASFVFGFNGVQKDHFDSPSCQSPTVSYTF